jgi:hypothetical protein
VLDPDHFDTADALNVAIAVTTQRHIQEHLNQWCIFRPFWDEPTEVSGTALADSREITV